jgi:hypothetical protein
MRAVELPNSTDITLSTKGLMVEAQSFAQQLSQYAIERVPKHKRMSANYTIA